jgi:hypothetical protein
VLVGANQQTATLAVKGARPRTLAEWLTVIAREEIVLAELDLR